MQITGKQSLITGLLITVFVAGGLWYRSATPSLPEPPLPEFTSVESASTSPVSQPEVKEVIPPAPAVISKFPINPADTIVSWSFEGTYSGNNGLIAKANTDNEYLQGLLKKGQYDDYDLYTGIANNYVFIGDGVRAYQNYNRATAIYPNKGLAYMNLGHLMDELSAYHTAADAYAKAVLVEPSVSQYRNAQLDFLMKRFPEKVVQ